MAQPHLLVLDELARPLNLAQLSEGWCPLCLIAPHRLMTRDQRPGYCFTSDRWYRLRDGHVQVVRAREIDREGWPRDWPAVA